MAFAAARMIMPKEKVTRKTSAEYPGHQGAKGKVKNLDLSNNLFTIRLLFRKSSSGTTLSRE